MRNFLPLLAALWALLFAATAQAQGWVAAQVSQPAQYTVDAQTWYPLEAGMEVPNRSWIQTGRRGRVILRRDAEMIQFKPSTVAAVTSRVEGGRLLTDVRQKTGSLLLDVQTRATRHTSVETPFLAAVVKGTRFEVQVTRRGAALNVERGLVETTHLARGERVDVQAGQSVEVSRDASRELTVTGAGPKAPVVQVAPVAPSVQPAMTPREAREAQAAEVEATATPAGGPGNSGAANDNGNGPDNDGPGNSGAGNGPGNGNGGPGKGDGGKGNGSDAGGPGNSGAASSNGGGKGGGKGNGGDDDDDDGGKGGGGKGNGGGDGDDDDDDGGKGNGDDDDDDD